MINNIIKLEELCAYDKFFNTTGIEESDVGPNIERLNLEKTEDFMAIVKKYEAKSAEWLVAKKAETEEMIKASQNIMTKVEEQALKAREQKAGNPEGGEEIKKEEKE